MAPVRTVTKDRPTLTLVGVVHGDPKGYNKTLALLQRRWPRLVSVEISEYSWRYRRRQGRRWLAQWHAALAHLPSEQRQHLALQRLAAQIAMPFEVRAAVTFARRTGRPWLAVDINALAREHLPFYAAELLQTENLRQLLATPDGDFQAEIHCAYERAARAWAGQTPLWLFGPLAADPQATMREKVLASRLARLSRRWGRVVHLGGWEHLVYTGSRRTLLDLLAPLQPQRLLLGDLPDADEPSDEDKEPS